MRRKKKIDIWREWFVPDNAYHRYNGLRGVYWYWLSKEVRKSDWEKYGTCLTCGEDVEDWEMADCGHIIASRWCGEYLRFHRENLTLQHKKCNHPRFTPQAGVLNAVNIDKRHGAGTMLHLLEMQKIKAKEPTTEEYRTLIRALPSYQAKLAEHGKGTMES